MSQLYPVHLGERDKYHVVEYPQGYSGLIRPDGSEVTSLTEPEDIHWHRELKPIHDELNILHHQLATLTQERDALRASLANLVRDGNWLMKHLGDDGMAGETAALDFGMSLEESEALLTPSGEAGKGGEV